MIEILESLREKGGKLAFCCVTPTIAKTFKIMGLLQTATVHESEQDALQAVSGYQLELARQFFKDLFGGKKKR